MDILNDAQLLVRIEAFLRQHKMKPTRFGREALNDGALVSQLRAGTRSLTLKSAEKVIAYMDAYQPERAAA